MSSDQFKLNFQKTKGKGLAEPRFLQFPDYRGDESSKYLGIYGFLILTPETFILQVF